MPAGRPPAGINLSCSGDVPFPQLNQGAIISDGGYFDVAVKPTLFSFLLIPLGMFSLAFLFFSDVTRL
jgi:hypothetical protein